MRKKLLLFYLLLFSVPSFAQEAAPLKTDSFTIALSAAKDDTNKVNTLLDAAARTFETDPDQSILFSNEALRISKKITWNNGMIQSYRVLSFPYWKSENWVKALELLQSSADLITEKTPRMLVYNLYNQVGVVYTYLEIYPFAMDYFKKSLEAARAMNDEQLIAIALGNIGWVYYNEGDYRAALNYGRHNLAISLKFNNKGDIANCYGVGGLIYKKLGMPDSAIYYFNKALAMTDYIEPTFHSQVLNGLGEVYMDKKDYETAISYLKTGAAIALANHNYRNLQDIYLNLSKVYDQLHDTSASYQAYKNYDTYRDSSNTKVKQHEVAFLQLQNETNKKDMAQEAALQQQTLLRNASIVGLLLAAIVLLVLIILFREKRKAHHRLEKTFHQLRATQQQLIQQEKLASLGQLTAGVAHEINNPINFVSGNINPLKRNFSEITELLKSYETLLAETDKKGAAEKLKKEFAIEENLVESEQLLKGIEEGSRRTAAIVKGLRNFSRMDDEEMKLANINEGIESTLVLLQNKLKHQNIDVIKSLATMPDIRCYPGQLNQVFMNLISNAIDAIGEMKTGRERKIFISTAFLTKVELLSSHANLEAKNPGLLAKSNKFVSISVTDTGDGISNEVMQRMFDPFYTTKEVGKGTGLGLSISYGIIEKHDGAIAVTSGRDKGTEFLILLPITA